ncbi:MAG: DUF58 domain-containing protein [Eubacterium sp.]|nr:DUF58 domain-containing protein [Eubacterium sp.]
MKIVIAILILGLVYIVQRGLYERHWNKGLKVSLFFNADFIECDEDSELTVGIENHKLLPLPVFHLKYSMDRSLVFKEMDNASVSDLNYINDVFSILGNQRIIRRHTFHGTERGIYNITGCTVHVRDFFLISTFAEQVNNNSLIYIFPRKFKCPEYDEMMKGIMGELTSKRSLYEDDMSFRGIREYVNTDGQRSINWKQTAKRNDLMVNLYDHTMDKEVRLLLNLDTHNMLEAGKLLEDAISLASTLSRGILKKKVGVSVATNGMMMDMENYEGHIHFSDITERGRAGDRICPEIGRGSDLSHAVTIDKMLSSIVKSAGINEFLKLLDVEIKKAVTNVLYIVISPYYKEDILEKLDRMGKNDQSILMIVPYYDKFGFKPERPYMRGWEVKMDEV